MHVQPRARQGVAGGVLDGALRVRVTAAPADGRANRAVRRVLATALDVPASRVSLVKGARSRRKRVRIEGDAASLRLRVEALASLREAD